MKKLIAISILTAVGMFAQSATAPASATTKSTVTKDKKVKHHHRKAATKTAAPVAPAGK